MRRVRVRRRSSGKRSRASWVDCATMCPRLSQTTQVSSTIPSATSPAVMRMASQPGAGCARTKAVICRVGTHPVEPIMRVAGGMASAKNSSDRASGSCPSANRVQPAQLGRRVGRRRRGSERECGRVEPEVEHVHDPDVDAARDLRGEAHALFRIRRVEGLRAVVARGRFGREVAQHEHGIDQIV